VASSPPTMAAYVIISTEDGSSMEVPLEMDHTLSLTMLQMAHPKTTCIKYRNPDTGLYRLIAPRNGLIYPPSGGWGSHCFIACTITPALEDRPGVTGVNNGLLPPPPPHHLTSPVVPKMSSPSAFPSHQMPSSSSSFLPRQSTSTSWLYGSSTISNGPLRQSIQPRFPVSNSNGPPRQPIQPRFPVLNSGGEASFYPSPPYYPEPVFIPHPVAPPLGARPLVTQPTPIDDMTTQQPGDKYRLRCNLCNIEVGSAVSLEYHYAGKRHQSNLRGGNIGGLVVKRGGNIGGLVVKTNRSSHRAGVQHRMKMAAKAAGRTIDFIVDGG